MHLIFAFDFIFMYLYGSISCNKFIFINLFLICVCKVKYADSGFQPCQTQWAGRIWDRTRALARNIMEIRAQKPCLPYENFENLTKKFSVKNFASGCWLDVLFVNNLFFFKRKFYDPIMYQVCQILTGRKKNFERKLRLILTWHRKTKGKEKFFDKFWWFG